MFAYSNNGQSMRSIDPGGELPGEVVFQDYATEDELKAAFPGDVSAIRAQVWERIKAERERRKETSGYLVAGKWFHSDSSSVVQQLGLKDRARDLIAAGGLMTDHIKILGQDVPWKTMDGTKTVITAQLAFDIVTASGNFEALVFAVAEAHNTAMLAAPDPLAYDFSTGWPAVFA